MKTPFQYNSVYTKCHAMSASLLKYDDYIYLSKITDLKDIANYLSEHESYSKEFKNIDLVKVNRNSLEQILNQNIYDTYKTLHVFTTGNIQRFIGAMKDRYEVDLILKCILKVYMKSDSITDNHFLIYDSKYDELYRASSFQEILTALENTPYYKVIKNIIIDDNIDIVYIETLLYDAYYNKLYSSYENNDKHIIAFRVMIENLRRILRLKYNFNLDTNQIYPYLIHIKNFNKTNTLVEMSTLPDDKFLSVLSQYLKIKEIPKSMNELISTAYIDNFIYRKIKKIFLNTKPSFETPFAFLSLKEYEAKNLIHIIEGVRYQVASDVILKYIVGLEG